MSVQKIGDHIRREEDPRLLRGRGRYVDDVRLRREARGYVLRSPHAHARIRAIDTGAVKASRGVLCILTGEDLKARGLGALRPLVPRRRRDGSPAFFCPQPILADGVVRYVGDPVAFVVAETLNAAKDAAELIEVDYEILPAVIEAEAALAPGAPAVWPNNPGNEAFHHAAGNKAAVDAAFARAAHVVEHRTVNNRITANSMEPRGCLAQYDPDDDKYTIRCTIQSAHGTRAALADLIFKVPQSRVRVLCDNMGGGFGMKGGCYPEYALSLWAAELTGRPVRWIGERSEGIMTDEQSRGSIVDSEFALDADFKFLGLRAKWVNPIGAYYSTDRPTIPITTGLGCLVNTYAFPAVYVEVTAVLTNTMTVAPIAAAAGPSRSMSPKASSKRRRVSSASIRPSCGAATRYPQARCPIRRQCSRSTTAATLRRTSTIAWRSANTLDPRRGRRRQEPAASCSASASRWRPRQPAGAITSTPRSVSTQQAGSCC
jgi:aerobic carbon-monoxide dehydrogenase large subunit